MTLLAPKAEMLKVKDAVITLELDGFNTYCITSTLYRIKDCTRKLNMPCLNLFSRNERLPSNL